MVGGSCPRSILHRPAQIQWNIPRSLTYTDILSGWTEGRAVWNKGAAGVLSATEDVENGLPFDLLGFDCDNGGEFLNHHLWNYMAKRQTPVEFTRSRPYHSDDNAHVEQKNWAWPRQLLGYSRLEDPELVAPIYALYKEVWGPLQNFFLPCLKLKPIFDSLKTCSADFQGLAKTSNGLGTTFPVFGRWVHGFSRNVGGRATPAAMKALCACPST